MQKIDIDIPQKPLLPAQCSQSVRAYARLGRVALIFHVNQQTCVQRASGLPLKAVSSVHMSSMCGLAVGIGVGMRGKWENFSRVVGGMVFPLSSFPVYLHQ